MDENVPDTIIAVSPVEFAKLPLFKSTKYDELEDILFRCALLRIDKGSAVIAPGQPNRRLYIVLRGTMSVHLNSVQEEPVAMLAAGDVFGELSVIDALPASAYVVARSKCRVLGIDKDRWWEMFHRAPQIAGNLLTILAKRIRDTNSQLKEPQIVMAESQKLFGESARTAADRRS